MVAKLKSISRQIHWSLLGKAATFALAWFIFPYWLFLIIALYLYFVPLFQVDKLAAPFLGLLILTFIEPASLFSLVLFIALFYFLLLIKDLLVIDRKSAYEMLVLVIFFFLIRSFYGELGATGIASTSLWYAFWLAGLFGLMINGFLNCLRDSETVLEPRAQRTVKWLSFILMWQVLTICLFLPLSTAYQSIIAFLVSVLITDLVPEYSLTSMLSRQKILVTSIVTFILAYIVLTSAQWVI
jgi:hypothetical protein